jgi:hypothetical protein
MKKSLLLILCLAPLTLFGQLEITHEATPIIEDFEWFAGTGFSPNGGVDGSLDSDLWYTQSNYSDSRVDFGETATDGEFARGTSTGGASIEGGIYAFNTLGNNTALGIKPSADFYNSGLLVLKIQNKITNTANEPDNVVITSLEISYDVWYKNTTDNITRLDLYFSEKNGNWTSTNGINGKRFASPAAASGDWEKVTKQYILTHELNHLNIQPDGYYYLKFYITTNNKEDFGDEVAIDNLKITANSSVIFSEILQNPVSLDANDDEIASSVQDEFIEFFIYDSKDVLNLEGWKIKINGITRHVFPSGSGLIPSQAAVIFGGGTPQGDFGGALLQTASTGDLSIPDSGEITISLTDPSDNEKAFSIIDTGEGLIDDAWHMDGYFVKHTSYPTGSEPNTHSPGKHINNIDIYLPDAIVWNNKINDWTEYSDGLSVTSEVNIIINGSYTPDTWDIVCDNLIINGSLTTTSERYITISKNLINPGSYTVESGGILHAPEYSLGVVSFKRNSPWSDTDGKYSFIGSPVKDFTIGDLGSEFNYRFDEPTNSYVPVSSDQIMDPGVGFTSANKKELIFTGVPNTGNVLLQISKNTSGNGFNLLSNPYSAPISFDAFMATNGPSGSQAITGTMYIWDDGGSNTGSGSTSDFRTITAAGDAGGTTNTGSTWNGNMGSVQGFIVVGDSNNVENSVVFEPDMRQISGNEDTHFFRQANIEIGKLKLGISNGNTYYETLVAFAENATDGFDITYDGPMYSISQHKAKIYSYIDNIKFSVQTYPSIREEKSIELGIDIPQDGQYEINLHSLENADFMQIYLHDLITDRKINLKNSNFKYNFYATEGNDQKRFILIASTYQLIELENPLTSRFNINYMHGILDVHIPEYDGPAKLSIYDLSGRTMNKFNGTFIHGRLTKQLNYPLNKLYLLHVELPQEQLRTKFITQ